MRKQSAPSDNYPLGVFFKKKQTPLLGKGCLILFPLNILRHCKDTILFKNYKHNDLAFATKSTSPAQKCAGLVIVICQSIELSDFSTVVECLGRGDKTHLAVALTCHENHTLGLDTENSTRLQVSENTNLLAHHLLRCVELSDT